MALSIMEQAQAKRMLDIYKPCPFCGSHILRITDWWDDSGEYDAVECIQCLGTAPAIQWNNRQGGNDAAT